MSSNHHARAAVVRNTLTSLGKSAEKRNTKRSRTQAHTSGRMLESTTPSPYDPDVRRYGLAIGKVAREEW